MQHLNANPATVSGDLSQLQNTILNIALNSRDAMPKGGELILSTDRVTLDKNYMKKNNVSVAISAHGNSIRLFRKIVEKASVKDTVKWFIPYDKVFEYDINDL